MPYFWCHGDILTWIQQAQCHSCSVIGTYYFFNYSPLVLGFGQYFRGKFQKKTPWVFLLILFFILIVILWKISYKIKRFQPPLREYSKKSELCDYVDIYLVSGLSSYLRSTLPVQLWMEVTRGSVCTESQSGIISLYLKQLI